MGKKGTINLSGNPIDFNVQTFYWKLKLCIIQKYFVELKPSFLTTHLKDKI